MLAPKYGKRNAVTATFNFKLTDGSVISDLSKVPQDCMNKLQLKCDHSNIATIAPNGSDVLVSAVAAGTTTCRATYSGSSLSDDLKVHVINPDRLNEDINTLVSGKYTHLPKLPVQLNSPGRVTQGFDFYNDSTIYFSQMLHNGANAQTTSGIHYDRKGVSVIPFDLTNKKEEPIMTFYCSGHGQGVSIEQLNDGNYVWLGNYGTIDKENGQIQYEAGFQESQTISRVKWEAPKELYPEDIGEHYTYLSKNGTYNFGFETAVDAKNNRIAFRSYNSELVDNRHPLTIRIYNLSKVKNIAASNTKLHEITYINKDDELITETPTVSVKDLSTLGNPISQFTTNAAKFPLQGFDIDNGLLYAVGGDVHDVFPNDNLNTFTRNHYKYYSKIFIDVYLYGGSFINRYYLGPFYKDGAVHNGYNRNYSLINKVLEAMIVHFEGNDDTSSWNIGYFEPEGIRVSDGKLYINLAVKLNYYSDSTKKNIHTRTHHYILTYDLAK